MGFLPRRLIKQNLHLVDVYVEDLQNEFFNIVELPETFTSGRSAFKIFGSDKLKKGIKLKIEMLDSFGNTVYVVPVDLVGEEVKPLLPYRYVTVEVYRPPVNREGLALLTILGEIEPEAVDFEIPNQFRDSYNVRYSKRVNLDVSTVINTQPIRFYKTPTVAAQERVVKRTLITEVTQSTVNTNVSGSVRSDLLGEERTTVTGSQEKEDKFPEVIDPFEDLKVFAQDYKFNTGLYGPSPALLRKRGVFPTFASKEDPAFVIKADEGTFTAKMQGGTVTIPEHSHTIKKTNEEGNLEETVVTVPEYKSTILEVVNDSTIIPKDLPEIPVPTGSDSTGDEVVLDDFDDVPLTASFDDISTTVASSSVHFDSFLDVDLKNIRTFSGDIYRLRMHGLV